MIARIRVVVEIPYDYDMGELDENGYYPNAQGAADYAHNVVLDQVKTSITDPGSAVTGTVLDDHCLLEEVRES